MDLTILEAETLLYWWECLWNRERERKNVVNKFRGTSDFIRNWLKGLNGGYIEPYSKNFVTRSERKFLLFIFITNNNGLENISWEIKPERGLFSHHGSFPLFTVHVLGFSERKFLQLTSLFSCSVTVVREYVCKEASDKCYLAFRDFLIKKTLV